MSKRLPITVAAVAALALLVVPVTANAQSSPPPPTTDVYVVHGLNLGGQSTQAAGGTSVTVCAGGEQLIEDFQFGQVVGPVRLPSGAAVQVAVYAGAGVECDDPGSATLLIDQAVSPSGAAVALVATSAAGELALTPFALDVTCTPEGSGRLTAAHASGDTPQVSVVVDGAPAGNLTFGNSLSAVLSAGSPSVQVNLGETAVVPATDVPVAAQTNRLVFVVGNIAGEGSTPVVALLGEVPVTACATTTTTTVPGTTTTVPAAGATGAGQTGAPISFSG